MSLEWARLLVAALVGILGFAGVMYTIRRNAELASQHRIEEQEHERLALRTAIHAELLETKRMFTERVNDLHNDNSSGSSAWIPDLTLNSIYENSTGKIGLLTRQEIESLVNTYALISELPSRLLLFPTNLPESERRRAGFTLIEHDNVHDVATMYQNSLVTVTDTIKVLEDRLNGTDT